MCEIFGAFGWAEGLPFMKGLADTMLVSGINYFVPHAFSPKEEDTDCPPHFYNGGKNIQYPLFKDLMGYMSRCSHMLSDSLHVCDVAVYYNAEAEWSTKNHESINEICKLLTQNQIDFDIVPYDALLKSKVSNKRLKINGESYGALIVPGCEFLPKQVLSLLDKLALCDLPVILTDYLPNDSTTSLVKLPLDCIASTLRKKGLCHVYAEGDGTRTLKFYHATRNERDIYLFSCEGVGSFVDATITLKQSGECLIYEPWSNKCYRTFAKDGKLKLHLDGGNMLFAIFGEEIPCGTPEFKIEADRAPLPLRFDIAIKEEGKESFTTIAEGSECFDISAPNNYPEFSGYIKYNATFDSKDGFNTIDLGQVGEVAQAWLNGVYLGARINAPYKFDMTSAMKQGANDIEIIVTSNLAHKRHDDLSRFIQIPPSGIIGDISLCRYEK